LTSGLRTIVVATDFSDTAAAALAWAAETAREHRARIVVVHAATMAPSAPEYVQLPGSAYDEIRAAARGQLDALIAALEPTGLPCSAELVVAPAVAGIVAAATRAHADLVVAGTRGRTGWKRLLLGSTAARLVRDAPFPVLTVHPADARHPRPVRAVLVATDFSDDAWRAAEAALRIVDTDPQASRVVLLHVYRTALDAVPARAAAYAARIRATSTAAQQSAADWAARLSRPGLTVEVRVHEGYPPETIVDEATELGVDLIAMGTHGRSALERLWIGSTAERVLPEAPCPVLTVRARPGDAAS
jgi:nucleotide-binding universal stress UspA family protein